MTWRNVDTTGRVSMAAASSLYLGVDGTWTTTALSEGAGVPWQVEEDLGLYTGTAALEVCIEGDCPGGAPAAYPKLPFFSAWPDGRGPGSSLEVWAKGFMP